MPECEGAYALEPHDLAATKLLVGRDKDIALVRHLFVTGRLTMALVEQRLNSIPKTESLIVRSGEALARAISSEPSC